MTAAITITETIAAFVGLDIVEPTTDARKLSDDLLGLHLPADEGAAS